MSTYTKDLYNPDYAGETLYAKPHPIDLDDYDGDVIEMSGDDTADGLFLFGVDSETEYDVFSQDGADPASGDPVVGSISKVVAVPSPTITGPYNLTVSVEDDTPIELAEVRVFRTGKSEVKKTDDAGEATFTVDAATWNIAVSADGFASTTTSAVISADAEVTLTLTSNTVAPVTSADTCLTTIDIRDQYGVLVEGASVLPGTSDPTVFAANSYVIKRDLSYTTDSDGRVQLPLHRGQKYRIDVTFGKTKWHFPITTPDAATYYATSTAP